MQMKCDEIEIGNETIRWDNNATGKQNWTNLLPARFDLSRSSLRHWM